jgi:hypothetical protein
LFSHLAAQLAAIQTYLDTVATAEAACVSAVLGHFNLSDTLSERGCIRGDSGMSTTGIRMHLQSSTVVLTSVTDTVLSGNADLLSL